MLNQLPDSFAIFRLPNQTQTFQVTGKCSSEPTSISQIKENARVKKGKRISATIFLAPKKGKRKMSTQK
jgi:hypothetical protein